VVPGAARTPHARARRGYGKRHCAAVFVGIDAVRSAVVMTTGGAFVQRIVDRPRSSDSSFVGVTLDRRAVHQAGIRPASATVT